MGSFARIAAEALSEFIGGADDVVTKGSDDLVSTSMKKVDIDNIEEAKAMLGNKEQIDNWKKNNKVPKEEKNRRQTRKFSTEATALKEGDISGPEYRRYIRQNQPATEFAENDLDNMMSSFKEVVGALTVDKSKKGIIGLNETISKGSEVSSRLDIPAYDGHNVWVAQVTDPKKGKLYSRTAVLNDVTFDMTKEGQKNLSIKIATGKKTKTPFATMKGTWQDLSDKQAFTLAKKHINDPDWVQVGFNPERHSFFYDKKTMLPVFDAEQVVQIGPLVLAKIKKLNKTGRVERIGKLRKLRISDMPENTKPAVFNKGGIVKKGLMSR